MGKTLGEMIQASVGNATAEETRQALETNYKWMGPPPEEVVELLNSAAPEGGFALPPEEDIRRRQALTGTVRQKMLDIVERERVIRSYPSDPSVQDTVTEEEFRTIPRQLQAVVNFRCDSPQEYARRANIFLRGTPEEKGNLVLETFRPLKETYRQFRGHMPHDMTPDQIAENFDLLYDSNMLLMELDGIATKFPDIQLTDKEREELRQFPLEFDTSITTAYNYGQIMAGDYYAYFPPESFMGRDDLAEITNEIQRQHPDEAVGAIDYIGMDAALQNQSQRVELKKSLIRNGVGGFAPEECRWLKEDFTPYKGSLSDEQSPLYGDLLQGKTVHARLPDGSFQTLRRQLNDNRYELVQEPAVIEPVLDNSFGPMLDELSQQLEDTRSMFVRDSQEYKNMRAMMKSVRESVQKMGEHPSSDEFREELQEKMQLLAVTANAYLTHKEGEKLSSLAQRRVDAVQNILNFANSRKEMLDYAGMKKWQVTTQKELDEEARGKNLGDWLKNQEPVNPQLNELYKKTLGEFGGFDDPDAWKNDQFRGYDHDRSNMLAGIIVADEFIRQEREIFAETGFTGLLETSIMKRINTVDELGDRALMHLTSKSLGSRTSDEIRSGFISLDPKVYPDEVEFFFGELNCKPMEYMKEINRQYKDPIQPRGAEPDRCEKALNEFVDRNIRTPAASFLLSSYSINTAFDKDNSPESKAVAADLLRDCVLANMVQMERASAGKNGPGSLEQMMADPEKVKALQQKISAYPDFKEMVEDSISSANYVNRAVTELIRNGDPAKLARDILTKANPEVQKAASNSQPQLRQEAPAKKPVSPKNPQL